jgi:ankyrin repeat protein
MSETPLHRAAKSGDVDKARKLLEQGRYDVNSIAGVLDDTALHLACLYGHMGMARMLVSEFKADTTLRNRWGYTPLHEAACEGEEKIVISEFGCDTNTADNRGRTLLHTACEEGCLTLVRTLIC